MKKAVLSLSGGMDSSTLLLHLLARKYEVKIISFFYGQKHDIELSKAKLLVSYLVEAGLVHPSDYHVLNIPLQDLVFSTLMKGGETVPEGHYAEETMKSTAIPNRNKVFASILQAAALSWANQTQEDVAIAMGIHSGDHDIYPDCRQLFRDADYVAFQAGNWDAERVQYYTPYLHLDKACVLADGVHSCEELELDFNEIYKRTHTSYKPIETAIGVFSDYKSGSSVERVEAFMKLGRKDPIQYADSDTGKLVEWEEVVQHVKRVLDGSR